MTQDKTRETALIEAVQTTKAALLELLPKAEHRAKPSRGSTPSRTFEDAARERIEAAGDLLETNEEDRELALKLAPALDEFQHAVNEAWTYAIDTGIVRRITRAWFQRQTPSALGGIAMDEVESEAIMHLRAVVSTAKLGKNSLETYASKYIPLLLTDWLVQHHSPVELPRDVLREGIQTRRADIEEAFPELDDFTD